MKVFIDSNVLFSAALFPGSISALSSRTWIPSGLIVSAVVIAFLPSQTIGTAFLFFTNSKHDILSNELC